MKQRQISAAAAAALAACMLAPLQASQDINGQTSTSGKTETVVVTGCLLPSAATATPSAVPGTTGTSGSMAPAAGGFVLSHAILGSVAAMGDTTGAAASTTEPAAPASHKSFVLVGGKQSELEKLVNSRVEIKGKIEGPSSFGPMAPGNNTSIAGSTTGTAGSVTANPDAAAHPSQTLRVDSVRKVSGSCSGE